MKSYSYNRIVSNDCSFSCNPWEYQYEWKKKKKPSDDYIEYNPDEERQWWIYTFSKNAYANGSLEVSRSSIVLHLHNDWQKGFFYSFFFILPIGWSLLLTSLTRRWRAGEKKKAEKRERQRHRFIFVFSLHYWW